MSPRHVALAVLVVTALHFPVRDACSAPGDLDAAYGSGGVVVGDPGLARAVALQDDGRLVVVGGGAVRRFEPDGTLDTTFGTLGQADVGSSRVDLQACKLEYSIVSPK